MHRTVLGIVVLTWLAGCSSAPEAEKSGTQTSHLEADAEQAFEQELNQAYDDYDQCVAQSDCVAGADRPDDTTSGDDDDDGISTQDFGFGSKICDALSPLAGLEHPYFFVGASVAGGAVATAQGGVDIVWDLWNQQSAAFMYGGGGLTSLAGVEAAVYSGYGFGNKSDVIDAWSGQFNTASLSVGLPVLNLSAGGSGFASPDGSVIGGAVSVSIGLNWIPSPVNGGIVVGFWAPFNDATSAMGSRLWLTGYSEAKNGDGNTYLQYPSGRGLAASILQTSPNALGAQAAAQAVAMDVMKSQGLSITQLCGVTAPAPAPSTPAPVSTPKGPCDLSEADCRATIKCVWSDPDPNDDTHTSGGCSEAPAGTANCGSITDSTQCDAAPNCQWQLDLNDDTLSSGFCVSK